MYKYNISSYIKGDDFLIRQKNKIPRHIKNDLLIMIIDKIVI